MKSACYGQVRAVRLLCCITLLVTLCAISKGRVLASEFTLDPPIQHTVEQIAPLAQASLFADLQPASPDSAQRRLMVVLVLSAVLIVLGIIGAYAFLFQRRKEREPSLPTIKRVSTEKIVQHSPTDRMPSQALVESAALAEPAANGKARASSFGPPSPYPECTADTPTPLPLTLCFKSQTIGRASDDDLRSQLVEQRRHPDMLDLKVGRATDVGQVRSINEDSLLTLDLGQFSRPASRSMGLYVIADGMGGHSAGEVASSLAIQTVAQRAMSDLFLPWLTEEQLPVPDLLLWMQEVSNAANRQVFDRAEAERVDMGTTLIWAVVVDGVVYIANVGDSRAYLLDGRDIQQVSVDHSVAQQMVFLGNLTADEARTHPTKNALLRSIGKEPQAEVDVWEKRMPAHTWLLLCSDGLSDMVPDPAILKIVLEADGPQQACERLILAANQAGGKDNISAIVVQATTV